MSPLVAYFLGIITILIIFFPFWYLGRTTNKIGNVYKQYFCAGSNTQNANV